VERIAMRDYETDPEIDEIEMLKQENDRLHHLTTVLIDHIWKTGDRGIPIKEIDRQMKLFDDENENQVVYRDVLSGEEL